MYINLHEKTVISKVVDTWPNHMLHKLFPAELPDFSVGFRETSLSYVIATSLDVDWDFIYIIRDGNSVLIRF